MRIKILNALLFLAVIITNYLAVALPINGRTTGEISDLYANFFVPAGITFSIWGLIYLLIGIFVILQFRAGTDSMLNRNFLFVNSCVLNCYWVITFHYEQLFLSLIIMIALLVITTLINMKLDEERGLFLKITFGIYLGWLEIATIANVTALLVASGWSGFGIDGVTWAIILIASGIVISSVTMIRLNNPAIAAPVIWAFFGIVLKQGDQQPDIALAAKIAMAAVALAALWLLLRKRGKAFGSRTHTGRPTSGDLA